MLSWCSDMLRRAWWAIRVRWAQWWADGAIRLTPRLRPLTYRRYERACLLLGLDPDKVREGQQQPSDAELDDPHATGLELVHLVCSNDDWICHVLRQAEKPVAEEILAHVMASFFLQSLTRWKTQKLSYATTQNGAPSSAISKAKAAVRTLSAEQLQDSTSETTSDW